MASNKIHIGLLVVVLVVGMLYGGAMAQPSQSGCQNAITNLASCLNYVTGNATTPSSSCCSQLTTVVQSSPQCLCSLLNNNVPSFGLNINQTLALQLPGACKVQTPPLSQCKAATAPATSAASPATSAASPSTSAASPAPATSAISPAGSSNETPEPAFTPSASKVPSSSGSGIGSKSVPSTNGTSDGNITKAPIHFMLFVFFILWSGSAFTRF